MSDLPSTAAKVFQYADDIAVTYQAKTFNECEKNLEADIEVLNQFFIVGATSTHMLLINNWMRCSTALQSSMSIILNI
jgi:hypothetical protein